MTAPLLLRPADLPHLGAALVAEEARRSGSRSLGAFVKQAWSIFDPAPLVWNWHHDAFCLHLEAVAAARIRKLNINFPPRSSKSNIFAICWPAWVWIERPQKQFLYLSHEATLAVEHSIKCRQLVESDWYRKQYRVPWVFRDDQNVKSDFVIAGAGGRRRALAIKGGIIGKGGDFICGDDLLDAEEAYSQAARDQAWRVWSQAVTTRMNNVETGCAVLLGQRLHEDDPSGRAIATGDYESLVIPNEFDPARRCRTYHWVTRKNGHVEQVKEQLHEDPRTQPGELFFPQRLSRAFSDQAMRTLGPSAYEAQYNQDPIGSTEGALWTPAAIQAGRVLVYPALKRITVNVDPSGSAKKTADEVGIVVTGLGECDCLVKNGGQVEDHVFTLEDLSGRFGPEAWGRIVVEAYLRWEADLVVGEDNFGGQIIEDLIRVVSELMGAEQKRKIFVAYKAVHASRGKMVRAEPVAAVYSGKRAHHVGVHPLLEKQLCKHKAGSSESPGRLDALVWGVTELVLEGPAPDLGDDPVAFGVVGR